MALNWYLDVGCGRRTLKITSNYFYLKNTLCTWITTVCCATTGVLNTAVYTVPNKKELFDALQTLFAHPFKQTPMVFNVHVIICKSFTNTILVIFSNHSLKSTNLLIRHTN